MVEILCRSAQLDRTSFRLTPRCQVVQELGRGDEHELLRSRRGEPSGVVERMPE